MTAPAEVAEAVYQAYGRAMQDGNLDGIGVLVAEDVVFRVAYPFDRFKQDLHGRQSLIDTLRFARGDLKDEIAFERTGMIAEGDRVLIECKERGSAGGAAYESSLAFVFDIEGDLVQTLRIYLGWVDADAVLRARSLGPNQLRDLVLTAERRLADAVVGKDHKAADAMIDLGFVATGHAGNRVDKAGYLDIHFSPERDFTAFKTEAQEVRAAGWNALVTGNVSMVNARAEHQQPPAAYTALWRPNGNSWALMAWQETPIEPQARF